MCFHLERKLTNGFSKLTEYWLLRHLRIDFYITVIFGFYCICDVHNVSAFSVLSNGKGFAGRRELAVKKTGVVTSGKIKEKKVAENIEKISIFHENG